ncbi:hypothetical protein G6F37_012483 [Rhizopus arrhizus]|nr:hypothetical protein G6F38_012494 [Rhizopus arrhizus]KAG1143335.1 hypothetical protein G6F37_012483 [Rhizopus arrhizus]
MANSELTSSEFTAHTARPGFSVPSEEAVPDPSFSFHNEGPSSVPGIDTTHHRPLGGAPSDNEIQEILLSLQDGYRRMVQYVKVDRPQKWNEMQNLVNRVDAVSKSLDLVMGRCIEAQIVRNDQNLERFRRYIVGELHTLISEYGSRFARFVRSVQWPTVEACRDLNAPDRIVHYVQTHLTMAWDPMETTSSGDNADSSMVQDLKQMIRELQAQLLVERGRQAPADKSCDLSAVVRPDPGRTAGVALETSELSSEEIKERRKRVHIPTFSNGSIQEAKDWLAEYKSICHHLRFTVLYNV